MAAVDKYIARLMMLSFFLPIQWQPIALFSGAVYFIVQSYKTGEGIPVRNLFFALFLGATYFLYILYIPLTPAKFMGVLQKLFEYRLSYILVPVALALIAKEKLAVIFNELAWFVYGALFVCVATNIAFVVHFAPGGFSGVTHVTYRIFFEEFCSHHPTYMSMYLVFGAGYLLVKGERITRWAKYLMFYAIIAFLLPLLAKSPLIALGFIFIHQAWLRRKMLLQYKWVFAGMLLVLVASYLFVPFVSQRVGEMTGLSGAAKGNITGNSIYVRKMIWTVDTTLLRHYWLTGCGPGRIMYLLRIRYLFFSLQYGYDVLGYDPHNEYFYEWISFGLAGILLFVSVIVTHIYTAIKRSNFVYLYILAVFIITCFTESVLTTQHGLIFYSFFTSLFFFAGRLGGQAKVK